MDRPNKDMYFLGIAQSVSERSTCMRRKFGAVIVKDSTIVGTGYNGTARGVVNCYEVGCIKDEMESPRGQAYDYCPAVHAEENAIINSNRSDRIGATLYIAGRDNEGKLTMALPCQRCQRKIMNSQIKEVVILSSSGEAVHYDVTDYAKEDTEWYLDALKKSKKGEKVIPREG
jgi:dCMP deaminase